MPGCRAECPWKRSRFGLSSGCDDRRSLIRTRDRLSLDNREFRMPNYRVSFAKQILGVPFTVGSVEIARARDPERARRAAELRFARLHGVDDWRERADRCEIAATEPHRA
ncbi:hypothetical protein MOX02_21640 [Methylobacterium oxalidis]|uniref:Uncharacterized protein n=2 Tax=Methylobacterium oxalidis TaxID=944322 RepID=A0A512J2E2_9HYPH|nr:hypothetical protein MOX02_21640 [Methylobacterium oxalidis]GLS65045.1 hypothetical protein GCM10007888_34260 [Methylobacterium oxalidis]